MMIGEQRYQCVVQNCQWMCYCGRQYGNKCDGRNFVNDPVFAVRFICAIAASIPNGLATVTDFWRIVLKTGRIRMVNFKKTPVIWFGKI